MTYRNANGALLTLCAFSDEADSDFSGQIAALRRNGISLMELRSAEGRNVKDFPVSLSKEYRKMLDGEGIAVFSVASPLGKEDVGLDFERYLDTVKRVCETALLFGASRVRVFSFYRAYRERERVIGYLCRMAEAARGFGVTLCHENEKEIYGDTAERVRDLLGHVTGLRSVYDPANFLQVGEPAECTLPLVKESEYFHIKDVIASTGELVPAGYGDGELPRLLRLIGRDTVLSVEPHLRVFEGYSALDHTPLTGKFVYRSNAEAFDAAVLALKNLLEEIEKENV